MLVLLIVAILTGGLVFGLRDSTSWSAAILITSVVFFGTLYAFFYFYQNLPFWLALLCGAGVAAAGFFIVFETISRILPDKIRRERE